ncbi:MAG: hypothetical protein OSJ43_06295 [Oscillospiraceae bacterium]|nr:hypothetical protein [Oscillospiraceae bacterium]
MARRKTQGSNGGEAPETTVTPAARTTKKASPKSSSKQEIVKGTTENANGSAVKTKRKKFVIDKDNAKECGSRGGIKSGEVRRAKKDAREAMKFLLDLPAKGNLNSNLKELGYSEGERTNLAALSARIFTIAMSGNLDAAKELLKIAGYDPEEIRKERESLSSDERRGKELDAKINALMGKSEGDISINMKDEDDDNDVVIYMPQIASEEECQMKGEDEPSPEGAEEG